MSGRCQRNARARGDEPWLIAWIGGVGAVVVATRGDVGITASFGWCGGPGRSAVARVRGVPENSADDHELGASGCIRDRTDRVEIGLRDKSRGRRVLVEVVIGYRMPGPREAIDRLGHDAAPHVVAAVEPPRAVDHRIDALDTLGARQADLGDGIARQRVLGDLERLGERLRRIVECGQHLRHGAHRELAHLEHRPNEPQSMRVRLVVAGAVATLPLAYW